MTWEYPGLLLLLFAVPLLLWLRWLSRRPRPGAASSLLVWREVQGDAAPAARRRPPPAAWLEAAGALLLVLGLGGPAVATARVASEVRVLIDTSPSMHARLPSGGTVLERARALIDSRGLEVVETPDPSKGPFTADGTVVLTDALHADLPLEGQGVRCLLLGAPVRNAGITMAGGVPLDASRVRLQFSLEAHGTTGPVEAALRVGRTTRTVTLQPAVPASITLEENLAPGSALEVQLLLDDDAMAADDRVIVRRVGGGSVGIAGPDRDDPLLRAALACGAAPLPDDPVEPYSLVLAGPGRTLLLSRPAEGEAGDPSAEEDIPGATVVATDHPFASGVSVDPASVLGSRPLPVVSGSGEVVLRDALGPLVTVTPLPRESTGVEGGLEVRFSFHPGGTWVQRDPSFVVLVQNLVEWAAGGGDRVECDGLLDARETATRGETRGNAEEAFEALAERGRVRADGTPFLLLLGALCLAGSWYSEYGGP